MLWRHPCISIQRCACKWRRATCSRRTPPHGRTGRTLTRRSASPRPLGPPATRTASGRARASVGSSDPIRDHAQTQAMQVPGMLSASDRPGRVHSAGGAATECKLTRDNSAQAPRAESAHSPRERAQPRRRAGCVTMPGRRTEMLKPRGQRALSPQGTEPSHAVGLVCDAVSWEAG